MAPVLNGSVQRKSFPSQKKNEAAFSRYTRDAQEIIVKVLSKDKREKVIKTATVVTGDQKCCLTKKKGSGITLMADIQVKFKCSSMELEKLPFKSTLRDHFKDTFKATVMKV